MLFNSVDFAIFFPMVFVLYWILHKRILTRNLFLLIASYTFYGWWDWRFLILIFLSSTLDFTIGKRIYTSTSQKRKKILLALSLIFNLGLLAYFKYTNFFIESFVDSFRLFGGKLNITPLQIILPVGISFYTFQTLSYTIDIYRGQLKPTKDVVGFFTFVAFFPQLVAGPIERASHLLPQFRKVHGFDYKQVKSGFFLILCGLFKKMVIADRLAIYVNEVYAEPTEYSGWATLAATFFFAVQIYCDFSGYTDIAIGAARSMGFDLMKNFDTPYFSKSITEFWRRWHISLSTWFRDYLFIPLGGSKASEYRVYANLFIVFVVSGLWHGASMNFVIWGALHGAMIIVEKFVRRHGLLSFLPKTSLFRALKTAYIFSLVCFAWIFFRAETFTKSIQVINSIMGFAGENLRGNLILSGLDIYDTYFGILVVFVLFLVELFQQRYDLYQVLQQRSPVLRWSFYTMVVLTIGVFGIYGDYDESQFIYFQF